MKKNLKNTKGITLIALVISIIVILLLAGVTIATLTGDNGILSQAQNASQVSELGRIEEEANLILMESKIGNRTNGQAEKGVGTILNELKSSGRIEKYGDIDGDVAVTGIQFDINSITLGVGDNSGTLTATFLPENTAGGYYVEVNGKKYPVSKVNEKIEIGRTEITTNGSSNRIIKSVRSEEPSVATVEKVGNDGIRINGVAAGGPVTITVEYSENITTTISVTVKTKYTVTAEVYSEDTAKGSVSISPVSTDNKYVEGSTVRLTATANTGYQLEGWYNGDTKLSENNQYNFEVPASNVTITAKFKIYEKYGKAVNLGPVTANGVEMESDWKYFLEDTNNIYLMYGDYLENAQIPTVENQILKDGYNVYVKSGTGRDNLVNYLLGRESYTNTWNTINEAVRKAVKSRLKANGASEENATTAVSGITTKGAPTPEQWMISYNENYGTKLGTQNFTTTGQIYYNSTNSSSVGTSTTETTATGYLYTRDNTTNPIKWEAYLPSGYMNKLVGYPVEGTNMYYPHTLVIQNGTTYSYGYFVARIFDL